MIYMLKRIPCAVLFSQNKTTHLPTYTLHSIPLIPLVLAHLLGLAAIRPPALHLVPSHARPQRNVYPRRRREAKALCNLGQVQLLHVVDGAQAVAGVGVQIRLEGLLGALLQVVVLADELLQLGLDVDDLVAGELELDDGDAGGLEVGQEADFVGLSHNVRRVLNEQRMNEEHTWRKSRLRPLPLAPRAVRPTRWM